MTPPVPSLNGLYGMAQRRPLYSRVPALYFGAPPWVKSIARHWQAIRGGDVEGLIAQ